MAVQHVLGGLSETDSHLFRAHLLQCHDCRAKVGELRAIAHELADVERDEARQREAKRLETKRRDEERAGDQASSDSRRPRNWQVVVALLLAVIVVLGAWIFFLRAGMAELEAQRDAAVEVSRTLEAGREWIVESRAGLDAEVREHTGSLVVMVDGLEDDGYSLEVVDANDQVLDRRRARPTEGRFFALLQDLQPESVTVRLVEDGDPTVSVMEASPDQPEQ